jgi:hypothetical protein
MRAVMSYPTPMPGPAAILSPPVAAQRSQNLTLSRQQLEAWLKQAAPGDRVIYHRGYLAVDRVRGSSDLSEQDRRELVAVAKAALTLAERGEIHLIQRRIKSGSFSYLAVRTHQGPGSRSRHGR